MTGAGDVGEPRRPWPDTPAPPDRIVLSGVTAYGYHGVLEQERRDGQEFVVDVLLEVDLEDAVASDDLDDTVSYAEVADDIVDRLTGEPCALIESLAGRIAADALARDPVEAVEVVVHKPQAPVGHPFRDVEVRLWRERSVPVVIALGANLADPSATLTRAARDLAAVRGLRVDAVSRLLETDPVGGPEQPAYLNAVVLATTRRSARSLLARLHALEARHGRVRDVRWGPRTLDLDLIQYGAPGSADELISSDPALTLPHPRAHERAFVLAPWLDVDPDARVRTPQGVRPVTEVFETLDRSGLRNWSRDTAGAANEMTNGRDATW